MGLKEEAREITCIKALDITAFKLPRNSKRFVCIGNLTSWVKTPKLMTLR